MSLNDLSDNTLRPRTDTESQSMKDLDDNSSRPNNNEFEWLEGQYLDAKDRHKTIELVGLGWQNLKPKDGEAHNWQLFHTISNLLDNQFIYANYSQAINSVILFKTFVNC